MYQQQSKFLSKFHLFKITINSSLKFSELYNLAGIYISGNAVSCFCGENRACFACEHNSFVDQAQEEHSTGIWMLIDGEPLVVTNIWGQPWAWWSIFACIPVSTNASEIIASDVIQFFFCCFQISYARSSRLKINPGSQRKSTRSNIMQRKNLEQSSGLGKIDKNSSWHSSS